MTRLSPTTMSREEQQALLRISASHPRDHATISLALGTGLRLCELVGLNVGDVYSTDGRPRQRIRVRREIAKRGTAGDVFLPDALIPKLEALRDYKIERRESLDPNAALLCSQGRRRISPRRIQVVFREWQVLAGFNRLFGFHCLRHTSVTNVYRLSRDLFLAQRFARHASPLTTTVYCHPGDDELRAQVRHLAC